MDTSLALKGLKKFHYPGAGIALIVILSAWTVNQTGPFVILEGALYDRMVQYNLNQTNEISRLLLVQVPLHSAQAGDSYWISLLNAIESLGAASIAITLLPQQVSKDFYQTAEQHGNVMFARHLVIDSDESNRLSLSRLPEAAEDTTLNWATTAEPPIHYGVARYQHAFHSVANENYPALEMKLAEFAGITQHTDKTYLVNFMPGADRIPRINAERIFTGGIVPELIVDKHVLIGFSNDTYLKGVHTPVTGGTSSMSLLSFRGYALNTLLNQTIPTKLETSLNLIVMGIIAVLSLLMYQRLSLKVATWVSLSLAFIYIFFAWIVLSLFLVWLPAIEFITTQILMFLCVHRYKAVQEEQGMHHILLTNNAELQEKLLPTSFLDSNQHWVQIINLVNQTLDLNRIIFLERVQEDHRLKEIHALNCSLDSIAERRRDYERTPYSTAIEENSPIRLDMTFLEKADVEEDQYLVPLLFAGEVLGFWAFGINPDKAKAIPMFMPRLRDYGQQIAELLYHRQQWIAQQKAKTNIITKYLQLESGREVYKALNQTNELSRRRMKSLEQVFNGLNTATILYDLFGGLIQINQRMTCLLKDLSLPIYEMTALDLITSITELDINRARYALRHIILEHGTMTIPVNLQMDQDQAMILNIKPMSITDGRSANTADTAAFQVLGILFELIDITHYKKLYQLQETLVDRLNIQIRNDMQSLVMAANLLAKDSLPSDKRTRAATIVKDKINLTLQIMTEAQQHLSLNLENVPLERYPIDLLPLLDSAIEHAAETAQQQNVTINTDTNRIVDLVFAEPLALQEIFETLLSILIGDAAEKSDIDIQICQSNHQVRLDFTNTGFGIPNQRLQNYIFGEDEITTEEFKKLKSLNAIIEQWTGKLNAQSEVGEGMKFTLTLRSFI